jgi:phage/plasmid-like protein (TIGR03299 family)
MLQDGNRIWLLARIPKASFDLGNDRNDGFVLCATSHDGSLSTVAKPTAVRVVCQNTLSMATSNLNGAFKQKHTSALRVNQAKEVVASACASFSAHKAQAQRLKATPVTPLQLGTFVAELVQPELLTKVSTELGTADTTNNSVRLTVNEILNQTKWQRVFDRLLHDEGSRTTHALVEAIPKQRGGFDRTAWGLAQGVSYWTDHVRGRTADSRLNSAWFGPSDALKREAFALADSYAERQAA